MNEPQSRSLKVKAIPLLLSIAWSLFLLAVWWAAASAAVSPAQVGAQASSVALIAGDVAYSGAVTGTHVVWVGAFTTTLGGPPAYAMMRSGPGPYTLTVAAGTYHIYAGMDADDSGGAPDPTIDPMGAYAQNPLTAGAGAVITDVNIVLVDPTPLPGGSISGRVDYTGAITGIHNIVVFAGSLAEPGPPAHGTIRSGPGPYTITNMPDGVYLVGGFMDIEGDMGPPQPDEPFGWYDGNGDREPDPVVVEGGSAVTGIDITLQDPLLFATSLPLVLNESD